MNRNKITIIGGSGGMGKIFAQIFKRNGFEVTIYARNEERLEKVANELGVNYEISLQESVLDADYVMISIPISSTVEMIYVIAPYLKKDAFMFDITSLKAEVVKALDDVQKRYPINTFSIHPMFGPGVRNLVDYNLIFLNLRDYDDYNAIMDDLIDIFKKEGLKVSFMEDAEYHDKIMALVLGTPHMFNILFLELIRTSKIPLQDLMKFTGTTFLLQKIFSESIIQREVEMFGEIEMKNSEFHKILSRFQKLVEKYKEIILNQDLSQFEGFFSKGKEYVKDDEHFKKSYNYFYDFIRRLKKEK